MRNIRYHIALAILLCSAGLAYSQDSRTEIRFEFRVNSKSVDTLYSGNAARIREMEAFLRNVREDSTISITSVAFCGAASPEGSSGLNRSLARERLASIERLVRKEIELPDSIITRDDSYIPWEYLKTQVSESGIACKDEVLSILDMPSEYVEYSAGKKIDRRVLELQRLDNGKVWRQMKDLLFGRMRYAYAVFITCRKETPAIQQEEIVPETETVTPAPVIEIPAESEIAEPQPIIEETDEWYDRLNLKTNAIGWAMAASNAAIEFDMVEHWSLTLPLYWSSWNYFTSTLKFRTLTFQPEVRYWLSEDNDGWFAGAHFGLGWFNVATNGEYRVQDHDGRNPATGGGLAAGYRLPIGRSKHLSLEMTLGAGAYKVYYDKFHNEPNGLMTGSVKKTWFGIDQAAVSLVYSLGHTNRKGGRK